MSRIVLLAVVYAYSFGCGCAAKPTPAEGADLMNHAGQLARCQNIGRDAGSYAAYEACTREAGLR